MDNDFLVQGRPLRFIPIYIFGALHVLAFVVYTRTWDEDVLIGSIVSLGTVFMMAWWAWSFSIIIQAASGRLVLKAFWRKKFEGRLSDVLEVEEGLDGLRPAMRIRVGGESGIREFMFPMLLFKPNQLESAIEFLRNANK